MKVTNQVRQGDVLITTVLSLPKEAILTEVGENDGNKVVLAEGEATGHSHTVKREKVKPYSTPTGELYLEVLFPVEVEHQEHAPITLQPGKYKVVRQMEYWMDEVRKVSD